MIDREKHGPWAVIAGGSEGLAVEFADRLAAAGIDLVLLARSRAKMEALADDIRARHRVDVRPRVIDLASSGMLEKVAAFTRELEVGSLFYVAGAGGDPCPLVEQPVEELRQTIDLNVVGQTLLSRHFGKGMADRGRGAILLVGSLGCVAGSKRLAVYTASKAYTQILAEGLWAELAPLGVDVAGLLIGRTATPALDRSRYGKDSDMPAADPVDVVDFAIERLQDGPVIVPPELQQGFDALRSMPRRKAVQIMTKSLDSQTAADRTKA